MLRTVEAQPTAVTIVALTRALGLHENTVRGHLEQLHADGYLTREASTAGGRGRPAWLWRATTSPPGSAYAGLATTLAKTLAATSPEPVGAARAAGLSWGAEIAGAQGEGGAPRTSVIEAMAHHGFDPVERGADVVLRQCPLIEAATAHPEIVCAVHQGLVDGVLRARGETGTSRLLPFTAPGECMLHLPPG